MAAYYSQTGNSSLSPFLLLSIFVTFYLLSLSSTNMTSVKAVSFDFKQFHSGQKKLVFQGDAVVDDKDRCLVLTREERGSAVHKSVGRVLYETPIHLWNNEKGYEASFNTSFTFFNYASGYSADGLAFFLAPVSSQPNKVAGGLLGIFSEEPSLVQSSDRDEQVVAVEFDSYSNTWDPKDPHVGIDVHTITSRITKPWPLSFDYVTVSITYQAFYGLLNVSTGDLVEQHRVYSWSFSSDVF